MRQLFLVLLFDLVVNFTSAGILDSFLSGLHSAADESETTPSNNHPPSEDQTALALSNNKKWHTNSSSFYLPTEDGGQLRVDLCEGDILVPLSLDGKNEVIVKATNFPFKRSTPLICSWNVNVTKNCWRGMVTMKINGYSRLADIKGCNHGYYTVSPFMNDTKICGRINEVPEFKWYVENQQPENVTITLRHAGLNDGFAEGLGFTLSGECLPNGYEMTMAKANESYNIWLQQLAMKQSTPGGGPSVFTPSTEPDPLDPVNVTISSDESTTIPSTTLSPTAENGTTVAANSSQDLQTSSTEPPVLIQSNTSSSINQSLADSHPENVTVNLSTSSINNVTEIPSAIHQESTINSTVSPGADPVDLPDRNSTLSNETLVIPTTESTGNISTSTTKRPSSSVNISNGNPGSDIPWLILNDRPHDDGLAPEYNPSANGSKPESVQQSSTINNKTSIYSQQQVPAENDPLSSSPYRKRPYSPEVNAPHLGNNQTNFSADNTTEPATTSAGHVDQLLSNKKRPATTNDHSTDPDAEVILIDVVLKSPNKIHRPNRFQNNYSTNGSLRIPPVRSPSNSSIKLASLLSSKRRRPAATTIKASNPNRPNFYKPPLRNPLLTFDD